MQDFSVEVTQFAKDDVKVKIMTKIPVSGWSYDEGKRCLVENDDPTTSSTIRISKTVCSAVSRYAAAPTETSARIGFSISHSLTTAAPFPSGFGIWTAFRERSPTSFSTT